MRLEESDSARQLSHLLKLSYPPHIHPFRDEDAPLLIKRGVMRADEFPRREMIARLGSQGANFIVGGPAVAEFGDDAVLFVDQGNDRIEVGDDDEISLRIK